MLVIYIQITIDYDFGWHASLLAISVTSQKNMKHQDPPHHLQLLNPAPPPGKHLGLFLF
jgi:hypothetical protein